MALSYMFLVVVEPHKQMGESLVAGISDEYHGLPKGETLLESALKGPMAGKISDADRSHILQWINDGAKVDGYSQVEPIFATNCVSCHMANATSIPPLTSYEAVQKVAQADTGTSIADLARAIAAVLTGKSDDVGPQCSLIIWRRRLLALCGSMLPQNPAGLPLGDTKLGLYMIHTRTSACGA